MAKSRAAHPAPALYSACAARKTGLPCPQMSSCGHTVGARPQGNTHKAGAGHAGAHLSARRATRNRWCSSSVQSSGPTSTRADGLMSLGGTTRWPVPACRSIPVCTSAAQRIRTHVVPSGGIVPASRATLQRHVNARFAKTQLARPRPRTGHLQRERAELPRPRTKASRPRSPGNGGPGTQDRIARTRARADCRTANARNRPAGSCVTPATHRGRSGGSTMRRRPDALPEGRDSSM